MSVNTILEGIQPSKNFLAKLSNIVEQINGVIGHTTTSDIHYKLSSFKLNENGRGPLIHWANF